jgi:hypothetical protein
MALIKRFELDEIEANILHGIVPPIASPQFQIMNRRCRRYQRVSRFNAVALTELSQMSGARFLGTSKWMLLDNYLIRALTGDHSAYKQKEAEAT